MKRRMVVAVLLAVLLTASAYAQMTDFFTLVQTGTPQDVQAAIQQGTNVDAPDKKDRIPLMFAAQYNQDPEVITTLLKAGAEIDAQDENLRTPLFYALFNNNPEVIITLLKAGANAKAMDDEGKTAFDYAQNSKKLKGTDAVRQLEEASN